MKVKGPGDGPPPVDTVHPEAAAPRVAFAERLEAAGAPSHDAAGDVQALSKALAAGEVTAAQALERLVARCVDEQLGPHAPAAVRERVVSAVTAMCHEDPLFLEKLQRMEAKLGR